jgi:hypothetical protein
MRVFRFMRREEETGEAEERRGAMTDYFSQWENGL